MTPARADDAPLGSWRLPREIEADPRHDEIRAALARATRKLWDGGVLDAPVVPLTDALAAALRSPATVGRLVRGLESAAETLAGERAGLVALAEATERRQGQRVSRLLLVTTDGAERFYRQVERLALDHAPRVLVCVLDGDSKALGDLLYGGEAVVKLVLTAHKTVAAALLRALARP